MGFFQVLIRNRIVNFLAIALVYLQLSSAKRPVCNTDECKKLANMYRRNMNPNVNPCKNFYEYACHGWQEYYKNSQLYSYWSTDDEINQDMYLNIKELLDKLGKPREQDVQQFKSIYKACINTGYLSKTEPKKLRSMIYNINSWPMLRLSKKRPSLVIPCWITEKHYLKLSGESAFFDYKIRGDETSSYKLIIELTKPVSPYGNIQHRSGWFPEDLSNYREFLLSIIKAITPNAATLQPKVLEADLDDLMLFRKRLNDIIYQPPSKPEVPVKTKIEQFQHWYDLEVNAKESAAMNWLELINAVYNVPANRYVPTITPSTEIIVRRTYFNKLAHLMAMTNIRVLENHMHLYFVERHILLDPAMRKNLLQSFDDEKGTGRMIPEKAKWRTCIENINMIGTLEVMYLKEYFPKEKMSDITRMVQEAKRLLTQQITTSNWLNAQTKTISRGKVNLMQHVVGYSTIEGEESVNPLEANIYYEPLYNTLSVSASYLNSPMYGKSFPFPIDYGATFSSFGHELYHAFDKVGVLVNNHSNKPFWPQNMIQEYHNRLKCFEDQFSRYKNLMLKRENIIVERTEDTVIEDFADSMGLKLAYIGFLEKLKETKGVCATLPGFENFSCHKLFFLAYANTLCTYITPGLQKKQLRTETHSLAEIRVNVPVANIPDFQQVYGCRANEPMVLPNRCNIWN